ncbi:MAG TPA: hypothetical protein DEG06_09760 [Lachnospiraceae bacterium]|nr:hypothetical protein [Lachnospiraceae bacterium]HCA70980.1 hypothetical protein [Lachnospiraceae bacterium]HCM14098.1 hypothetical protein [Lachnospiraceae bacterium]
MQRISGRIDIDFSNGPGCIIIYLPAKSIFKIILFIIINRYRRWLLPIQSFMTEKLVHRFALSAYTDGKEDGKQMRNIGEKCGEC